MGGRLGPPALFQDNQSAFAVIESGGARRTRYFAVRAVRLSEEHRLGTIAMRDCPTTAMVAGGLAKLSSAETHAATRTAMMGGLPDARGV